MEKTFILKYPVINDIEFPAGLTVKIIDKENFIVTHGKLEGKKGFVADGLNGWLLDDTIQNRKLYVEFARQRKKLQNEIILLNEQWEKIPTEIITATP